MRWAPQGLGAMRYGWEYSYNTYTLPSERWVSAGNACAGLRRDLRFQVQGGLKCDSQVRPTPEGSFSVDSQRTHMVESATDSPHIGPHYSETHFNIPLVPEPLAPCAVENSRQAPARYQRVMYVASRSRVSTQPLSTPEGSMDS